MLTVDPIAFKDPNRIADWVVKSPDRFEFLVDTLFVMRQQFPERELRVELEDGDDAVLVVTPSDEPAFRFRHSEYCAIVKGLEPYRNDTGYQSFVERYAAWRKQFEEWWYGYQRFATLLRSTSTNKRAVIHTP
jgi:hypothetical protein